MSDSTIKAIDEFNDKYELLERIGQPGQFGYARKCKNLDDDCVYAVKIIEKGRLVALKNKSNFYKQLKNEIIIMKRLQHPNIIDFIDCFENEQTLYIVMELCVGGELFDRISSKGSYSERDASVVLKQIMLGIKYIHENQMAHLDLKPDNFLFLDEREDSPLKIIDFGMSAIVEKHTYMNQLVGTPYYVAPEVLEQKYTNSCDIWSAGVILFVLLFGYPPFYANPQARDSDKIIFMKIREGFFPETRPNFGPWFPNSVHCSDSAKNLISKMLVKDSAKRLCAEEVLEHPWVRGVTAGDGKVDGSVVQRLLSFKNTYKMKEAFLNVLIRDMPESDLNELKQEFDQLDLDKTGYINPSEIKLALASENPEERTMISQIMQNIDLDNDGKICYREWCIAAMNKRLLDKEERIMSLFAQIDVNNDGVLSKEEIRRVILKVEPEFDIDSAWAEVDVNHDGNVDYQEFLGIFEKIVK